MPSTSTTVVLLAIWAAAILWLASERAALAAGHGAHIRLVTPHGPVHVWAPKNLDPATAGIVVYVHGYFTNVDDAWHDHHLARQFAESGINAVFIACEAPRGANDPVRWNDLSALLDAVGEDLDGDLPSGRIIVVGHSGAHRTVVPWLASSERIDTVVLVDALYGEVEELRTWYEADPEHRLIDAAVLTRPWSQKLVNEVGDGDALVFDRFPPAAAGKLPGARDARLVYVRSQHDHMELVTGGVAIPMLLRALQLPLVADVSRKDPIRAL